jgi:hypothetical protein
VEDDAPPPPRRSSSSAGRLKRAPSGDMPEAPPRRSRESLEPVDERPEKRVRRQRPAEDEGAGAESGGESLEALKKRQARRRALALVAMVLLSVGALVVIFQNVKPTVGDCVPIRLTVTSNPKAHVIVQRGGTLTSQPIDLGETPIEEAAGACVGDTILLINEQQCLRYEESIQFGEPNEVRKIERSFAPANLTVMTKPALRPGIGVFCNGQRIGVTGMNMQLYEGPHRLELRDDRLTSSIVFEVTVVPKVANKHPIELGDALRK